MSADFMAAFMATLQGLLDQQMLSASGQVPASAAGMVQSGENVGTAKGSGASATAVPAAIDPALLAALQQEVGVNTDAGESTEAGDAQSLIEQILARLGARLEGEGAQVSDATESEGAEAAPVSVSDEGDAPTDPNAAAMLAELLGLGTQPNPAPAPVPSTEASLAIDVDAGMSSQAPAATLPDQTASDSPKAAKPDNGFGSTLLALQGGAAGKSRDALPTAETEPAATVAAAAQDSQPRPAARAPASSRTEERMRRIASEIAALTGGEGISGTIEISGRVKPVTPVADASVIQPDATSPDPAGQKDAAGLTSTSLADLAGGKTGPADPLPTIDTAPRPVHHLADPAAGAIERTQTAGSSTLATQSLNHHALAAAVMAHAARKETRFEIRMDPAELGKVDVTLDITASGTVRAHMAVERADTLDMMLRDQSTLTRQLEQAGLKLDSGGLEFSLRQDNGSRRDQAPQPHVPAVFPPEGEEAVPPDPAAATRLYNRSGASGLDMRV